LPSLGFSENADRHFDFLKKIENQNDEQFWAEIRNAWSMNSSIINLNNGGVSPAPRIAQEALETYNRLNNEGPSYFMWRILDQGREPLRRNLAEIAGCSPEEIAVNRNASEALETVIFGIPLERGDEVVVTNLDYPNMKNAWLQREKRDGIVLNWVELDPKMEDNALIINRFVEKFNSKTKLVHITHCINWTGQILPVRAIADAARARKIEVLIDGAHTFAQLDYRIPDLGGDYFGTSLHKWLCAPIGSGMLWVKKEKISKIYPLFAAENPESDDIRKFESLGTRSFAIEQAIGKSIDMHHLIGAKRKQDRLFFLKNYWAERVQNLPKVNLLTSLKPEFSGAIGVVAVEGKKNEELEQFLFSEYKIHTVTINWKNVQGTRITPNVYTQIRELDKLVEGIERFSKK
jgi:selenocysteine lyase/cysteine desulfurase